MNIQAVNAYTSQLGAAGGAAQGASIAEPAQQRGVSPDSLDQLVGRSLDRDDQPDAGTDQSATDETPLPGYTADGQRTAARAVGLGTISVLA